MQFNNSPLPADRARLRFELARLIIERHPAARALPRVDAATFDRDQLIRELTASKGYTANENASPEAIR